MKISSIVSLSIEWKETFLSLDWLIQQRDAGHPLFIL